MKDPDAKILVVDDDELMLDMVKRVIEKKGVSCVTSSSSTEALALLRCSTDIKLILLDINMPEMTGLELFKLIKKTNPSINVIMITGLGDMDIANKCMELGAKDFITKPFDLEYFETSIMTQIIPLL